MIQINLLPVRSRKKRGNATQFLALYAASIVLAVVAIGWLWMSANREHSALERQLGQVSAEVKKWEPFEKRLNELTGKKGLLEKKRKIIGDLEKDRDKMARILAMLGVETPVEELWIEKFSQTGPTLSLDGVARSNESVAEFMKNLETSPYIEEGSVNLMQSRQTVVDNAKLREFRLTCRFLPFSAIPKNKLGPNGQPPGS